MLTRPSRPDGSQNLRVSGPLVAGGSVQFAFAWAPDSSRIAYLADQRTDKVVELFTSRPDGSGNVRVSGPLVAGGNVSGFAWAPDSSRVAYSANQLAANTVDLFTSRPDGSGNTMVSAVRLTGRVVNFAWAPNSSRIAYLADQTTAGLFELFTSGPDGSRNVRISGTAAGQVANFAWAPDSSRLAYIFNPLMSFSLELFTSRPDGTGNVRVSGPLTSSGFGLVTFDFAWSPNGTHLGYISRQRSETLELFTARPDGSLNQLVSSRMVSGGAVADFLWTRDGMRLVYRADQRIDEQFELFSCAPDGGAVNVNVSGQLTLGGDVFNSGVP